MYTLDYLNCFIENLDLPEASRASLRENCETLVTTPGAIDELVSAETLLFKDYGIDGAYGAEWKPIVPHMDALSERTGLHRHVVDFLFLALASERLRENYRAAGLTDELFWDTIADLKFKLIECHDVYGIWGTFVASWYPWFYTMHRFKLGRLQYEAVHFSGDAPVTVGGYTVKPGDTVYNMHIPSCGSLNRAARIESYKKAYEFYKKEAGEHQYLTGDTYEAMNARQLLNQTHLEILSEETEKWYLFDYQKRDPLTGDARIIQIQNI